MCPTPEGIRVLHVDDEPAVAEVAATYLQRQDERFDVDIAAGVDEGLARLDDGEYDCVVSDYDVAERTGVEFLRAVRERSPDLPFILFTGKGSEAVASDAISAGATDYLQKETGTGQYEILANRVANAVSRAESQRAARHLRELAENTDRVLYIFDPDWEGVLFINSAYEEVWGRPIEELRADPADFLNGVHPDDRERADEAMERLSSGETVDVELRVNPAEEYGRWVAVRGEPITDDAGDVVRLAGFATDVTERKELERTLQERTERLQEAQRVAGVGSWEWDAATDTVEWSEETYRIFGWGPDEGTDPTFDDWLAAVHPEDRERAGDAVERAMDTGSFPTFEHRIRRPGGEVARVRCRGEVTRADDGTLRITGTVLELPDRGESEAASA